MNSLPDTPSTRLALESNAFLNPAADTIFMPTIRFLAFGIAVLQLADKLISRSSFVNCNF
jgi:hypothetical protein